MMGQWVGQVGYAIIPLIGVLWATAVDLIRREIPNVIPMGITLWAVLAQTIGWLPFGWGSLAAGCLTGLTLGAVGFRIRSMGGGDVKLLAALGAAVGVSAIWTLLFWTALAGGILGLIAKARGERELAFAPAIAAGLVAVIVRETAL
jgi:prepilin peptidase CpaA